jgi:hypothetical protein
MTDDEIRNAIFEGDGEFRHDDFMQFNESDINKWIDDYINRKNILTQINNIEYQITVGVINKEDVIVELADLWYQVDMLNTNPIGISEERFQNDLQKDNKDSVNSFVKNITDNILNEINTDNWIKIFDEFEEKLNVDANPVLQILNLTSSIFGTTQGLET